jgi:hypothetical protein
MMYHRTNCSGGRDNLPLTSIIRILVGVNWPDCHRRLFLTIFRTDSQSTLKNETEQEYTRETTFSDAGEILPKQSFR